jgi:2-polyprenyl-3-methyl-5-hydroxy-6-metoxy-1,4-benzoquinol methylase
MILYSHQEINLKIMNNEFQIECIENKKCFCCGNDNLKTILDLGNQPLANDYHNNLTIQHEYPLRLNLCDKCFHLQLSYTVNPDLMFRHYLYVSGTTQTLKDYFDFFATKTLEYNPEAKTILDIACNDGTQLDSYKKLGLNTYGIDPAKNLYDGAIAKGHNIVCDYFNIESIDKFGDTKFDIITAQNVFAHNKYTVDFLLSCKELMGDKSTLFIQTSQANMVLNNEFDTIYHEHLSFFNTKSMKTLVERCGLVLSDVFKTDIHGTSYVFVITKNDLGLKGTQEMLDFEESKGLYNILTYPEYALKCYKATYDLKDKLEELKAEGYHLVGYGAAAKGNTLLNFGDIKLDVIIDDNPLKQDLYTPGMNIPIKGSEYIKESFYMHTNKVAFIPLAWNFYSEIKSRIKTKRDNPNDLFIKYFPTLEINEG